MSKYKMGDEVSIKGRISRIDNTPGILCKYRIDSDDDWIWCREEDLIDGQSKTYEDGLNDAWVLVEKILEMSIGEREMALSIDEHYLEDILVRLTPQEALKRLEAYEKLKIQVGDVVECFSDYKGVVLDCDDELGTLDVFSENGCVEGLAFSDVKKTGRHIDISNLLEQIRGNE